MLYALARSQPNLYNPRQGASGGLTSGRYSPPLKLTDVNLTEWRRPLTLNFQHKCPCDLPTCNNREWGGSNACRRRSGLQGLALPGGIAIRCRMPSRQLTPTSCSVPGYRPKSSFFLVCLTVTHDFPSDTVFASSRLLQLLSHILPTRRDSYKLAQ